MRGQDDMKRLFSFGLTFSLVFALTGCGGNSTEPRMTADEYTKQLWEAYEAAGYVVNELDEGIPNSGTDPDIGEYDYVGYIISDGVYVGTYECNDVLLRVQAWLDLTLASDPDIELGAFAIGNLIQYADPDIAEDLTASLGLDSMEEGVFEADGNAGHYKSLIGPVTTKSITLIYTLDPPPSAEE